MKKRHVLGAAAVALLMALAGTSMAGAAPAGKAQAQVLGNIQTHADGTASLTARYICPNGFHLWVSVKQVADARPDKRLQEEGSSQHAAAWLQSHPTSFTCNGTWQTDTFTIDTDEQGWGQLEHGQAWAQFCLIGEGVFISETRWVEVA